MQQEQLFNLLDTVPDSVLICSQQSESNTPKSLYSNRRMKEFFGGKISHIEGEGETRGNMRPRNYKKKEKNPLNKPCFKKINDRFETFSLDEERQFMQNENA